MVLASKLVLRIGILGLLHAAYSATQHRAYLRLTEQDFEYLPADILFQTVVCFVLVCFGLIGIAGKLKPIDAAAEFREKTWDSFNNRVPFYCFHNRNIGLNRLKSEGI